MKVVYQDLINHLSVNPSKEMLSEKLFQLGHEHEMHGDIFDIDITPNRGDCLSLKGLARDLNAFFNNSETIELYEGEIDPLDMNFENLSPIDCPKISFLEIEIDKPSNIYKEYLQNYYNSIGHNKTNLFTDISNYISYELGQPTHCFDADKLLGNLIFQNKFCDSTFETLLGHEIKLNGNNCVFSVNNEVVSLAGVMGGSSTACSTTTKKVLVECAYFNPESIIGKSVKYNLTSDAAHKFERGVDSKCHEKVLRRFAKIVSDHAKIKTIKFKSFLSNESQDKLLEIDLDKVNRILGTELGLDEYLDYLKSLNFEIINNKIKVPSYRNDIKTQNDLAEEIARIIGYNNIESSPIKLKKIVDHKKDNKISLIESILIENGFSEVINFPFTPKEEKISIKIDNPLDSNRENFRTSLQDSLIENLLYNERRQKDSIKLFEISDIYTKHSEVERQKKLGIIVSGRQGNNSIEFAKNLDNNYLHEILNGNLKNNDFKINEIHRNNLDTKKKDKIFYVEIPLDDIPDPFFLNIKNKAKNINFITYKPVSEYPSSKRDFSFLIANPSKIDEVINILNNISDEIIKDFFIFDYYKNDKAKTLKLGCRFIFQSPEKTLSDNEINIKAKEILTPILDLEGISIPGML